MLANKLQKQTGDFPCLTFPRSEFANEIEALYGRRLGDTFQGIENPRLMSALLHFESNLLDHLSPSDDRRWRGVISGLRNAAGENHAIWRLARRVSFEEQSYTLNLHFTPGHKDTTPHNIVDLNDGQGIIPISDCRPHRHPFGDIAVAIHEGAYYMGVSRPGQSIEQFEWGVVAAGNCYFMSGNLQHGTIGLSSRVISVMVHEKVARNEIEANEFAGIDEMPQDVKSFLLNLYREIFSGGIKPHNFP